MGSLRIHVATRSRVALLDPSQEDAQKEVLDALNDAGYVVLKDATSLDSVEHARQNKYVIALLASARNGNFASSTPTHKPYPSLALVPFGRSRDWKKLAAEQELVAATCYHLGGNGSVQWNLLYDVGLRRGLVNSTATIKACGRDIIICNSWLARQIPIPETEVDMIMIMYRWGDFDWNP